MTGPHLEIHDTALLAAIEEKCRLYQHWINTSPRVSRSKNGNSSHATADTSAFAPTNTERSALEHYRFMNDKPLDYFFYPSSDNAEATTWTGQRLGKLVLGKKHTARRDSWLGSRYTVGVIGDNGHRYRGTLYGTYIKASVPKSLRA